MTNEEEKEMKYMVDSIDLTDEELKECIANKNYDAIIRSFSKVVSKYTKGYGEDLKQDIYVKIMDEWTKKGHVNSWKKYLYEAIKNKCREIIKYKYNYKHLTDRKSVV